jgi:hypothetical protein
MKIFKLALGMAAGLLLASCNINELPEYDDSNAFVAFTSSSVNVGEEEGSKQVEVLLTSIGGIETTVNFEVAPAETAGAVEGKHYTIEGGKSLTFTKDAPTQKITLNIIDNDTFDGDVKFTIKLLDPEGVQLGASKTCSVTIEDDEHPLLFILGTLSAKGVSDFNGDTEWEVRIAKDDSDLSKVWIYNLVPGGSSSSSPVYGIVNDEKTEIRIPVGQEVAVSSSYPHILLNGFYGDTEEKIPTGGYITGEIAEDGTISIKDYFGSQVFSDDAASNSLGLYNLMDPIITLKKQ